LVTKETAIKEINGFVALCRKNGLVFSKVIFFGSAANGTYHEDSDIDVMLFSDKFYENVIENKGMLSPYIRNYYNLDIKTYPSYYFERGGLLIDEVKKNGLDLTA
jgi:predicted nucleotidyltransferase